MNEKTPKLCAWKQTVELLIAPLNKYSSFQVEYKLRVDAV